MLFVTLRLLPKTLSNFNGDKKSLTTDVQFRLTEKTQF